MTLVKKTVTEKNIHHTFAKKLSIIPDLYKFKQVSKQKNLG